MRPPIWEEVEEYLKKRLERAHMDLEAADVPNVYRFQAEAVICRELLHLPSILDIDTANTQTHQ